jgi:hypothetical protein
MVRITKQRDNNIEQEYFDNFKFVPMLGGQIE